MQPKPPKAARLLRFLQSWGINTFAVMVAVGLVHGHITCQSPVDLIIASLLLGILNAFVKPVLMLLALPLVIFSLGLFTFVINALMLYGVGWLMGPPFFKTAHFQVDSFGFAFLGALIISVVSMVLNVLTGGTRVSVRRRRPPPPGKSGDDDDKPVIDV